jgi:hypothetical protein
MISIATLLIFSTACSNISVNNDTLTKNNTAEVPLSKREQHIIKNGYQIGNHRFKLLGIQKNDSKILSETFSDIDVTIKNNFEEVEQNIDTSKKINLLPTLANYDDINEKLIINYFLVNNSLETIKSIRLIGTPEFQNIKSENNLDTSFSEKEFTTLKQNEFVAFTLTFSVSEQYIEQLKEIKNTDLKINIESLEINGKKTDNNN